MQIAEASYTLPDGELRLIFYFDLKAFEHIKPSLNKEETENLMRILCDSFAAGLKNQVGSRHFFIKRVLINPTTQQLKILCTDGFLIDSSLILPISERPFSKERIHISEIQQLPTRLNLSNEMIQNMNKRLPLFTEEEVSPQINIPIIKEPIRPEKPNVYVPPTRAREITDVLFEIGNIKKEIREISQDKANSLKILTDKIENIEKYLQHEMMKDIQHEEGYLENKKLMDDFAMHIISQAEKVNMQKNKEILQQKIMEISAIFPKFESQIEVITQSINEQIKTLTLFKQYIIHALYESAKEYYHVLLPQIEGGKFHQKKFLIAEFNKKFMRIAEISETGELSGKEYTEENLQFLSFEDLQDTISKDEKENPGLLEKCNTSWTEESSELKIVLQNLTPLNDILKNLLSSEEQFSEFSGQEMITITRTPFPRKYQFKFTQNMLNYKKAVQDFCIIQKDKIVDFAQQYKKTMQVNEIIDKSQLGLMELKKQADSLKTPLILFKDLLKREKIADAIINNVNKDLELTQTYLNAANQLQDKIKEKNDMDLNSILPRIRTTILEIKKTILDKNKMLKLLNNTKYQIDMEIQNTTSDKIEKPNFFDDLNDKISMIENIVARESAGFRNLHTLKEKLDLYETVYNLSNKIGLIRFATHIKNQKNESKSLLLQFVKNQMKTGVVDHDLKRNMIDTYSRIDAKINTVEKTINDLNTAKNKLFFELNTNTPNLLQLENDVNNLAEKWQSLDRIKKEIDDSLSRLREL